MQWFSFDFLGIVLSLAVAPFQTSKSFILGLYRLVFQDSTKDLWKPSYKELEFFLPVASLISGSNPILFSHLGLLNIDHLFVHGQVLLSSVQFSCSAMSDSLQPHELQHARPPCPSPTPGVHPNPCPLSGHAIQPSGPLSSPSPPALNLSQHQGLFK